MPLYKVTSTGLVAVDRTDFAKLGVKERQDLQRFLRDQIEVLDRDLFVLAEEFGQWDGANRRIDLLAIDRNANLVVIELKRTESGGHMELQAIRYAAMVANMTFEQAVEAHKTYLEARKIEGDAEQRILEFLGWSEPSEDDFGTDSRIVLVAADFSKELTTSVLWLIEKGLDIRGVRLRPHRIGEQVLLQVEQILPLPEAQDYVVGVREKKRSEARSQSRDFTRFNVSIDGTQYTDLAKRQAVMRVARHLCEKGVSPEKLAEISGRSLPSMWRWADGDLDGESLAAALAKQAADGGPAFEARRWFLEDESLVRRDGKTYTFSKMWGTQTERIMRAWVAEFPNYGIRVEAQED